ncbi:acyl-CoA carboxylase subunit epsilon, partial [Streptomyces lavendulocolor]|uniref:acyl-CoA carboxylase subunit epsilon n=1 Tax=Streptomyces lavendulocolor TaxID=67316 RepID=UPI0033F71C46
MLRPRGAAEHGRMSLHLRIVHGRPTPTELAALTAVLTALVCRTGTAGCRRSRRGSRGHWGGRGRTCAGR